MDTKFEQERRNVGAGWQPLVEKVHADLSVLVPGYPLLQIKEKFGGLRYYIGEVPDGVYREVSAIVDAAEAKSFTICEECGAPGRSGASSASSWVRTLCVPCRENFDRAARLRQERFEREVDAREGKGAW